MADPERRKAERKAAQEAAIQAAVQAWVDKAPPLTQAQVDKLVMLLRPYTGQAWQPTQADIRAAIERQVCPWCGEGPFRMLVQHTRQKHDIGKYALRDAAGYTTREPVSSPETRARMRELTPTKFQPGGSRSPRGKYRLTQQGRANQVEAVGRWQARLTPEERSALAKHASAARGKSRE